MITISFDFEPLVVWIYALDYSSNGQINPLAPKESAASSGYVNITMPVYILKTTYTWYQGFGREPDDTYGKRSEDGKTIYWYNSSSSYGAVGQLNRDSATYYYIAFG